MKRQIKKFSVHQTGKVIAFVHWAIFALVGIPLGFWLLFVGANDQAVSLFGALVLYFILFYVMGIVWAFVYNLVASTFGGIELTLSDEERTDD